MKPRSEHRKHMFADMKIFHNQKFMLKGGMLKQAKEVKSTNISQTHNLEDEGGK